MSLEGPDHEQGRKPGLRELLARAVDRCIPDSARENEDDLLRARILVSVCSSVLFAAIFLHVTVPIVLPLSKQGAPIARMILLAIFLGTSLALLSFRLNGSRRLAANLLVLGIWGALFPSAFRLGGIDAPTLPMLILLPVIAVVISGRTFGVLWALIAVASWTTLLGLDQAGHVFPQAVVPENYRASLIINHSVMCLFVTGVMVLYSTINQNLRRAIARERAELDHLAGHDPLTQLPNRRTLRQQLERGIQRASRADVTLALLIIDLDDFKPVNDRFGHGSGDLLLQELGSRLRERVRATDCVARIGGDEFALVFEHVKRIEDVEAVAKQIIEAIRQPAEILGQQISVSASVGAALFPVHATDPDQLQEIADAAMYRAKKLPSGYALADPTWDHPRAQAS